MNIIGKVIIETGQKAFWFPHFGFLITLMIGGSHLNAAGGYAEDGILEFLKYLDH